MPLSLADSWWLAKKLMRDNWLAYPISAIYFALMGALIASQDSGVNSFAHIVIMFILVGASLSRRNMSWDNDSENPRRLAYLRTLPLPPGMNALADAMGALIAGVINAIVYFSWFWFLPDWRMSFPQFLAWVIFWFGFATACSGLTIVTQYLLTVKQSGVISIIVMVVTAIVLAVLGLTTDLDLIKNTRDFAIDHPVIAALTGVAIGIVGLGACLRWVVVRYPHREFRA